MHVYLFIFIYFVLFYCMYICLFVCICLSWVKSYGSKSLPWWLTFKLTIDILRSTCLELSGPGFDWTSRHIKIRQGNTTNKYELLCCFIVCIYAYLFVYVYLESSPMVPKVSPDGSMIPRVIIHKITWNC
jgi:hypothetical protein